ncbi:MAG: PIN domain-containing protein [Desulfurococcales archaeon]|nr:PIN domain-containing protein [Desulfurococcales archaeon]
MILLDTNILYHIIHKTNLTEKALTLLEDNPGEYVVDTIVHNELIYTSTLHYLEHRHGVKGAYSARKWIRKHGYPREVISVVKELIERLDIRLVQSIYTEEELYEALLKYRLLPSDAIIALTCKHYGIKKILTFDEDFKRVPWLTVLP